MNRSIRSFIAFDIDNEEILNKMKMIQDALVQTQADLKLVEPKNVHITLRFLGNIAPEMVDKIHGKMMNVQFVPFETKIHGVGAFPNARYPRVIWCGITEGQDQLRSIFIQLEKGLMALGFSPDPKGFSPHLTIARVRSNRNKANLAGYISESSEYDFGKIKARCIKLKSSTLMPKGPIYSTLKEFCAQ